MKTALRGCGCVPFVMSGGAVLHSARCRRFPNQRLTQHEAEGWRAANLIAKRAEERETRELLRASILQHPANGTLQPLRSVRDPDYVDHWSDRDDDDGGGF